MSTPDVTPVVVAAVRLFVDDQDDIAGELLDTLDPREMACFAATAAFNLARAVEMICGDNGIAVDDALAVMGLRAAGEVA